MIPAITVKDLNKHYGNLHVLDAISIEVKQNECVAILGPSGGGKSTLLKCVIGLEAIEEESIQIEGKQRNEYLKNKQISYVPQKYANYPWLTVEKNIAFGFIRTRFTDTEKTQKTSELIEQVSLNGSEKQYPGQLSGGMQQRVAIARALAQNTPIIAMDEPLGALDYKTREKLQLIIKNITKTILFVTHDVEEALFIADKIIILSGKPCRIVHVHEGKFRACMSGDCKYWPDFIEKRAFLQKLIN